MSRGREAAPLGLLPPLGGSLTGMARGGQVERMVRYYLPAYAERFRHIRLFTFEEERLEDFTDDRAVLEAVRLVTMPGGGHRAARALWAGLAARRRLLRGCAIVRAFHAPGALPALLSGAPYVCTYGYAYREFTTLPWDGPAREGLLRAKRAAMTPPLRTIVGRARAVIATTAETEREARALGARDVRRIPNAVDLSAFRDGASAEKDLDVVFVGRLVREKNLGALVEALAGFPGLRVAIVGDGPARGELERGLRAARVEADLLGALPNAEVARVLRRARAFVLPSLLEGHPKALIEAMAAGLPCVAMDVPALAELVAEQVVEAASPPTAAGLAAALRRVLDDPAHAGALARRGRRLAEERYDLHRTLAHETELLATLAAGR